MSNHLSEKLQKKLAKEDIAIEDNDVRFTVTHLNNKGKVIGREWYKGYMAVTDVRMVLASEGVKFLNAKGSDERFSAVKFKEDNVACLEVRFNKEAGSKRGVVFHIYTSKVNKALKCIDKL